MVIFHTDKSVSVGIPGLEEPSSYRDVVHRDIAVVDGRGKTKIEFYPKDDTEMINIVKRRGADRLRVDFQRYDYGIPLSEMLKHRFEISARR